MIHRSFRLNDIYTIDCNLTNEKLSITLDNKPIATINCGLNDRLHVKVFHPYRDSKAPHLYHFIINRDINKCPRCKDGHLYLTIPSKTNYSLMPDGKAEPVTNSTRIDEYRMKLFCFLCGINSVTFNDDNEALSFTMDENNEVLTSVNIDLKEEC